MKHVVTDFLQDLFMCNVIKVLFEEYFLREGSDFRVSNKFLPSNFFNDLDIQNANFVSKFKYTF